MIAYKITDSINLNLSFALIAALDGTNSTKTEQINWITNRFVGVHYSSRICNGTSIVTVIRNDYLTITNYVQHNATSKALLTPWTYLLPFHEIAILNSGAHAVEFQEYEYYIRTLKSYLDLHYTNGIVLFRTTPRGHDGCKKYIQPIEAYNSSQWYQLFPADDPQIEKQKTNPSSKNRKQKKMNKN